MKLLRGDLYCLIWSLPGLQVAKMLGISSSALTRLCRRNGVPPPGRGYWRRVEVGQVAYRPPLPPLENEKPLSYELNDLLATTLAGLPPLEAMRDGTPPNPVLSALVTKEDDVLTPRDAASPSAPVRVRVDVSDPAADSIDRQPKEHHATSTPSVEHLFELSAELVQIQSAKGLLDSIEMEMQQQSPPVAAILRLWLHEARRRLDSISPAGRVVDACRRVASGQELPKW